jgi:integrase
MALRTGLRQGEILALEWGDIDSHGGFIEVRRTNYLGHIGTPKNGKTRRVDMSDGLREALAHHKQVLAAEALAAGKSMAEWVFPNEGGKPFWAPNLRKRFDTCLRKAGLRRVPFHALRHSYASALIALGEPLAYVQAQLGHASIAQTVDTYGHMIEGANRKALNRLDDLGKPATPAQPAVSW